MIPLRRVLLVCLTLLAIAQAGCGKKGPPLAPLRLVPAPVEQLTARRLGDATHLEVTVPSANQDGSRPADLARIEIYGLTTDPAGRRPDDREFLGLATRVATLEIRPPPSPDAEVTAAEPERTAADARPSQGSVVSVDEMLSDELRVPVRPDPARRPDQTTVAALPSDPAATGAGPTRTYVARAFSTKNRPSALSPRIEVALAPAIPSPTGLRVTYSETAFTLSWDPGAPDPWRPLWPAMHYAQGFNVYEAPVDPGALPSVQPLNASLQLDPAFELPLSPFGVARCFAVRAVAGYRDRLVESAATPPVCATPLDTFPPPPPTGLAAVAETGAISLIWNAVAVADAAGYLILRGEAPGDTLQPITPSPIRETTWRDTTVQAGVRYVYAVVAVDNATPPNRSEPSARVEETAR